MELRLRSYYIIILSHNWPDYFHNLCIVRVVTMEVTLVTKDAILENYHDN